jgi:hypothetical protein
MCKDASVERLGAINNAGETSAEQRVASGGRAHQMHSEDAAADRYCVEVPQWKGHSPSVEKFCNENGPAGVKEGPSGRNDATAIRVDGTAHSKAAMVTVSIAKSRR